MYLQILKKDLKRKRAMNVILLVWELEKAGYCMTAKTKS